MLALSMLYQSSERSSEVTTMTTNKILKRLIPMVLAGVVMLVIATPMTANARDWDHQDNGRHNGWDHQDNGRHNGWDHQDNGRHNGWDHQDNGRHNGWVHQDRDDFHHYGRVDHDRDYFRRAPRVYYPNNNYRYAPAYGRSYAGPCNVTRLQNVYRQDRATGHPAAANDVARQMRLCGGESSAYPYSGYYGQNGSVFAPLLGNFGW
jgi:Ni/Co efflux regulator RcnB